MRLIASTRTLEIPSDVTIEVKARKVRVKGPRGTAMKQAMEEEEPEAKLQRRRQRRRRRPDRPPPLARRETPAARCFAGLSRRFCPVPFSNCGLRSRFLHAEMATGCTLERMQARISRSK